MDAVIHVSQEEFNDSHLLNAIENVENGKNLTLFALDEYEDFKEQLLTEP